MNRETDFRRVRECGMGILVSIPRGVNLRRWPRPRPIHARFIVTFIFFQPGFEASLSRTRHFFVIEVIQLRADRRVTQTSMGTHVPETRTSFLIIIPPESGYRAKIDIRVQAQLVVRHLQFAVDSFGVRNIVSYPQVGTIDIRNNRGESPTVPSTPDSARTLVLFAKAYSGKANVFVE